MGRPVLDGWVSGPEDVEEGGLSTVVGKHSIPRGLFFKTSSPVGDEVPRPRRPALGPYVCPVGGSSWPLGPNQIYYLLMGKLKTSKTPRVVSDQALEVAKSDPVLLSTPVSGGLDVLLMHDLPDHLSYRAIHDLVKPYGSVVGIRRVYDDDTPANRCYVVFSTARVTDYPPGCGQIRHAGSLC